MNEKKDQQGILLPEGVDPDEGTHADVGAEELDAIEEQAKTEKPNTAANTGSLKTFSEIVSRLSVPTGNRDQPIPPRLLRQRSLPGGGKATYIDWQTAVRLLNTYAPGWSYVVHPTEFRPHDGAMVVKVTLTIPTSDMGNVSRDGFGIRKPDDKGRGDAMFAAEHQAMKRAASKFGLALYLYDRD